MDRIEKKMESNAAEMTALDEFRIDEILAADEEIVPSSGFLSGVMERVEEEARMPARIPFPWRRALPGMAVVGGFWGWMGVELGRAGLPAMGQSATAAVQISPGLVQPLEQAGWVGLALALSLASWLLARRLAGRAELL